MQGRTAIIGAGLSGLTAAAALDAAGRAVTVFDKSRGVGGRLATRRTGSPAGELSFDHGAPCATGADPAFLDWLAELGATTRGDAAWGRPGMSALLRPVAQRLDLRAGAEVAAIRPASGGWTLAGADGAALGAFEAVILAIPAPQALRLLPKGTADAAAISAVRMAPAWTLLAAFETPLDTPDLVEAAGAIARAERQSSRPGRPSGDRAGPDAWVVQFTPAFTRATLEQEKDAILPDLLQQFADVVGPLPSTVHAAAHRWRYARTEVPLGAPFAGDAAAGLLAGGDWALGPDALHAWQSGQAMARALLSDAGESG
ncbi:NAD(P)/FAD-dependent oxidoreductase [Palleronia sp. KMU-117]|uniref:NAD(P)/FAD-dependent oxidoreductase n=1 Tax=Palleronia sp. KMU-117 TaxID=3434108 RepID=UPI003D748E8C